jgi:hypothetical protein
LTDASYAWLANHPFYSKTGGIPNFGMPPVLSVPHNQVSTTANLAGTIFR